MCLILLRRWCEQITIEWQTYNTFGGKLNEKAKCVNCQPHNHYYFLKAFSYVGTYCQIKPFITNALCILFCFKSSIGFTLHWCDMFVKCKINNNGPWMSFTLSSPPLWKNIVYCFSIWHESTYIIEPTCCPQYSTFLVIVVLEKPILQIVLQWVILFLGFYFVVHLDSSILL